MRKLFLSILFILSLTFMTACGESSASYDSNNVAEEEAQIETNDDTGGPKSNRIE